MANRRNVTELRRIRTRRNGQLADVEVPPIFAEVIRLARRIPREELRCLPKDLIENLDHYGTSKR